MQDRLVFLIGAPRSGTTLLARMLSAHSLILGRAEPHLITPLAHLGYFASVQKARQRARMRRRPPLTADRCLRTTFIS